MIGNSKSVLKQVGKYTLVDILGKGQFGEVFRAVNQYGEVVNYLTKFAVKRVDKNTLKKQAKLVELFEAEINIMRLFNHPNIVHFVEVFQSSNNYYVVLEFCNQGDLESYINKNPNKRMIESEAKNMLEQLLSAFQKLHEKQVMHRDFKLQNIFMDNGIPKIGDFGFAKRVGQSTQTYLGTPLTMAPEVLQQKPYDHRADLYSLGNVYYQMLFGHYPYDGMNTKQLIQKQKGQQVDFKRDGVQISPECKDFIMQCLAYDPNQRLKWDQVYQHPHILKHEFNLKSSMFQGSRNKKKIFESHQSFYQQLQWQQPSYGENDEISDIMGVVKHNQQQIEKNKKIDLSNGQTVEEKNSSDQEFNSANLQFVQNNIKKIISYQERMEYLIQIEQNDLNHNDPIIDIISFLISQFIRLKIQKLLKNIQGDDNFLKLENIDQFKNQRFCLNLTYTLQNYNTIYKYHFNDQKHKIPEYQNFLSKQVPAILIQHVFNPQDEDAIKYVFLKVTKDYLNSLQMIGLASIRLLDGLLLEIGYFRQKNLNQYIIERQQWDQQKISQDYVNKLKYLNEELKKLKI